MSLAIGIDVGGTKVLGGIVDADGKILASERRDTPAEGGAALIDVMADVTRVLLKDAKEAPVGISIAGFISADRKTMYANPNIRNFNDIQLERELSSRVDANFAIENDANCAAWAEFKFGAGRNTDVLVMLTVGTGVGGGIVINGEILRGHFGIGAEVGHMRVMPQGELCGCGQRGCFEAYASGTALVRYGKSAMRQRPSEAAALLERTGGNIEALKGSDITAAAQSGDPLAIELFAHLGTWLGEGIASINALIDPQLVVIGGGVVDAGELLLAPTRAAFMKAFPSSDMRPVATIVAAEFVNNAGLVGAADLARN